MSVKLKPLSKFFLLYFLLQISSCSLFQKPPDTNVELICPGGRAILIKYIHVKELREAINVSYLNKKRHRTSENYTPIRLKDGRSFAFKNLPPEVASTCDLLESKVGQAEPTYIHHF